MRCLAKFRHGSKAPSFRGRQSAVSHAEETGVESCDRFAGCGSDICLRDGRPCGPVPATAISTSSYRILIALTKLPRTLTARLAAPTVFARRCSLTGAVRRGGARVPGSERFSVSSSNSVTIPFLRRRHIRGCRANSCRRRAAPPAECSWRLGLGGSEKWRLTPRQSACPGLLVPEAVPQRPGRMDWSRDPFRRVLPKVFENQ